MSATVIPAVDLRIDDWVQGHGTVLDVWTASDRTIKFITADGQLATVAKTAGILIDPTRGEEDEDE